METPITSLRPVDTLFVFLVFKFAFAFNNYRIFRYVDRDILLAHAGKICTNDQFAVTLEDIDLWGKPFHPPGAADPFHGGKTEIFENAVHLIRKTPHQTERQKGRLCLTFK